MSPYYKRVDMPKPIFIRVDSIDRENKKVTWNWGAFFFMPYWFFFRKMYKLGAIFLALTIATPFLPPKMRQVPTDFLETDIQDFVRLRHFL